MFGESPVPRKWKTANIMPFSKKGGREIAPKYGSLSSKKFSVYINREDYSERN